MRSQAFLFLLFPFTFHSRSCIIDVLTYMNVRDCEKMKKRDSFNNKWGFILACIGSAVGMGNIWMFPTRISMYGGGSYLLPYFLFVARISFTGVIGEMSFGRAARSGPVDAFGYAGETKGHRKAGALLGYIPVLGALAMAIGYTVVMGWILKYMIGAFSGATLAPADADGFGEKFGQMAASFGNNGWQVAAYHWHDHPYVRYRTGDRESKPDYDASLLYPVHHSWHLRSIPAGRYRRLPLYFSN